MPVSAAPPPLSASSSSRRARWAATAAVVLGTVVMVLTVVDLFSRAECPPGYGRLIDPQPPLLVVAALATAAALGIRLAVRRGARHRVTAAAAALLAVLTFGLAVVAALAVGDPGIIEMGGCWTF